MFDPSDFEPVKTDIDGLVFCRRMIGTLCLTDLEKFEKAIDGGDKAGIDIVLHTEEAREYKGQSDLVAQCFRKIQEGTYIDSYTSNRRIDIDDCSLRFGEVKSLIISKIHGEIDSWSNTHILFLGDVPKGYKGIQTQTTFDRVWDNADPSGTELVQMDWRYREGNRIIKLQPPVCDDDVAINGMYFDLAKSMYPDCRFIMSNKTNGPVAVMVDGEIKGLIMPMLWSS